MKTIANNSKTGREIKSNYRHLQEAGVELYESVVILVAMTTGIGEMPHIARNAKKCL